MALDFDKLERELQERGRIDRLDNGAVVISEDNPGFGLARGEINIGAGSYHEEEKDQGAMHFLEHMIMRRTTEQDGPYENALRSAALGLRINAETGLYQANFPIHGENDTSYLNQDKFGPCFMSIFDSVFRPSISETDLKTVREVIQRELEGRKRRLEESKQDPLYETRNAVTDRLIRNNRVEVRDGTGTKETIDSITTDTLRKYHNRFFVGENIVVSVQGDIRSNGSILDEVTKHMGVVPQGVRAASPPETKPEAPYSGTELLEFHGPHEGVTYVSLFFQIPSGYDPKREHIKALSHVLGGGIASMLYQDLREKRGLVYGLDCSIDGRSHSKTGFLKISYEVKPEKLEESLHAVQSNIDLVKAGNFRAELVEAYKERYSPHLKLFYNQPGWIVDELRLRMETSEQGFDANTLERGCSIDSLTQRDVVEAARNYLTENRLLVIVHPKT